MRRKLGGCGSNIKPATLSRNLCQRDKSVKRFLRNLRNSELASMRKIATWGLICYFLNYAKTVQPILT